MNQDNNFNTQGYNNFTNTQANPNISNNYTQPSTNYNSIPTNNKPPKKFNVGLIAGIGVVVVAVIVGGILLFNNNSSQTNNSGSSNNSSTNNESAEIVYFDNSRNLKDSYTFKEAVSKFAFKVNETTLIFEEKDKTSFYSLQQEKTIHDENTNVQFYYKQDIYTSLGTMYLGESNSTTLDQFKSNFINGILSDKTKWTVENVNVIESNNDYVFASWTNKASVTTNEYYFAKVIGNKVYYVYNSSLVTYNDTKISLLLDQFKQFFECLSVDDGNEPYIYDKIINVPIVLNKKIKDIKSIYSISNNTGNDYLDGSVNFVNEDNDFINLEYGANKHYDKIDWSKSFDSKIKYTKEDDKNIIGIKDNNITQLFEITIYSDYQINNAKDFESYISTFLTNK